MKPAISVIIPNYNSEATLKNTLESLKNQEYKNFEIILVDDASTDNSVEIAKKYLRNIIVLKKNSGPAEARNIGIKKAKANIVAFTDSDCIITPNWTKQIIQTFKDKNIGVVMGRLHIKPHSYVADSISALGFPAGGSIGFDKIWKVDKNNFTTRFSSCNLAIRKSVIDKHGAFDESFPYAGGEEGELSFRYSRNNVKIKYNPNMLIFHEPRKTITSFIKWQIHRGKGYYHFIKKVPEFKNFTELRLWSTKNVLKEGIKTKNIFLIVPLLILSLFFQILGYLIEFRNNI